MRLLLICVVATILATCNSCDVGRSCRTVCDPGVPTEIIMFDDINDIDLVTDPASIEEITIEGNTIHLTVTYGGGCGDHEFTMYASRAFLESYPVQALLFLSHDAHGDPCRALITSHLEIDLMPLRRAYVQGYDDRGPIRLRVYEPGLSDPVRPLPVYTW